jgi:predicted ribosome quality control (RQC) complex YloA/Tae2 family protein
LAALEARAGEQLAAEKERLVRALKARAQKLARTLGAVERDSAQASRAVAARRFAELLLPMQAKIARGAKVAVVPDWSQLDEEGRPAQVSVALDPALGAAENASRMLKKAHRYAAAAPRIAARLAEISRALEDAKSQLARAERATDAKELRELSESSGRERRSQPRPARSAPQGRLPYRAFRASNGARILVGRSAKDNDALTSRARGDDLWLHARGVHGSHVILAEPGHAPDSRALAEAALLAAHFSSARGAHFAEVSWTRRKYVRKGKGLAPGAVTFSQEKTLRVRLDEPLLQALLAREE